MTDNTAQNQGVYPTVPQELGTRHRVCRHFQEHSCHAWPHPASTDANGAAGESLVGQEGVPVQVPRPGPSSTDVNGAAGEALFGQEGVPVQVPLPARRH